MELGKLKMESWLVAGAAFQAETITQRIKKKCETLNTFLKHALPNLQQVGVAIILSYEIP